MLSDQDFLRYQRQIALSEITEQGQTNLSSAHVLIVGCGGLGSAAGLYLAAAGVGKLVLVDDDLVESSNLQRQIVYRETDLKENKVTAMAKQLNGINSSIQIRTLNKRLDEKQLSLEIMLADVVLDCSDNLPTRQQINRICYQQNKPLISGAAIGWQGQFAVFEHQSENDTNAGCYRCLYPFDELKQSHKCSESGIVGPVVGMLGNYQALAAIQKLATGQFHFPVNQLHVFDGLSLNWRVMKIAKDKCCQVCGQQEAENSRTFKA